MKDYVKGNIARRLRVPESYIGTWRLSAERTGHSMQSAIGNLGMVSGMVTAELVVTMALTSKQCLDLEDLAISRSAGGFQINRLNAERTEYPGANRLTEVEVILLRGKDTQHIFKALYQTMTVRGPQKRKKTK